MVSSRHRSEGFRIFMGRISHSFLCNWFTLIPSACCLLHILSQIIQIWVERIHWCKFLPIPFKMCCPGKTPDMLRKVLLIPDIVFCDLHRKDCRFRIRQNRILYHIPPSGKMPVAISGQHKQHAL